MARRTNFSPKNRRRDMARHLKMRTKGIGILADKMERAERLHVKRILATGETPEPTRHRHAVLWWM